MFWGHSGTDHVSLTNDNTFYSISNKLNRGKKKNTSLSFRYFDLKNGISIIVLISMKILIKLRKIQKTCSKRSRLCSSVLYKCKFQKKIPIYKLVIKENEKILPAISSPHCVRNAIKKKKKKKSAREKCGLLTYLPIILSLS